MINDAIIRTVKYPPEKIPDSWAGTVPNLAETAPPVLDLRRFKPYLVTLSDIQMLNSATVIARARYDGVSLEQITQPMMPSLVGAWSLPAKEFLYYNHYGLAATANYLTHYGIWVKLPTVADKLVHAIALTPEERDINERLGIADSVEKGVLPLPISFQIEREYHVLGEETHTRNINIAAAGTVYAIENIYARNGEFLVLTRMAAQPATVAQNVRFVVDRDDDHGFATVTTFPLSLTTGGEVTCFIPAMNEVRLSTVATAAPGPHLFRYTFQRVRLTNTLRVRFGLVSRDELPEKSLYDRVKGGFQ